MMTDLFGYEKEVDNKFPIAPPSDRDAFDAFEELKVYDPLPIIKSGPWFSRSDFDKSYARSEYIDIDKTGLQASNRHFWATRMACDSVNAPSPIRSWYQPKHRATLENSPFFENSPKTAIALRKYIASQFRPTAALAIYKKFNATSIYDPCGGWGDRMVAAMAKGLKYHCHDTNPLAVAGYASMQHMFGGNVSFNYCQSEIDAPNGEFDLVFTSPPYWKVEKYQGELSSFKQHKSFDDWMKGFMFPMLEKSFDVLKSDGHMVINVSDCYANHTYNKIVQPILDHYKSRDPYVMGYKMAKRIGSKSNEEGTFCEPVIVIKK